MGRKGVETLVGVFVLLGMLGLLFLALKAANLSNIGGLKVRAPVRSAGVTVGRVASITLDSKRYQGAVKLEIDRSVQFPSDSSARILTSGLLGDQYIGIEPGALEKNYAPNDEIRQTQSAVVLENLISQFLFSKAADAGTPSAGATSAPRK
jgi:phospholipid/cholesterol/gamma-HCH transport system substrate-binding protein